jgi:hypothetical protein
MTNEDLTKVLDSWMVRELAAGYAEGARQSIARFRVAPHIVATAALRAATDVGLEYHEGDTVSKVLRILADRIDAKGFTAGEDLPIRRARAGEAL